MNKQPWLGKVWFDSAFILLPPFVCLLILMLLPEEFRSTAEVPLFAWVALVMCIDVAHVYSTLFRTYFDYEKFIQNRRLYLSIPFACFVVGVLLYSMSSILFWRVLAYLAVFHFVRQQYGFMRLYSRKESALRWQKAVDTILIYSATLLPLLYWHLSPGRNFNWFVQGDFFQWSLRYVHQLIGVLYISIIALYLFKETLLILRTKQFNLPRNILLAGTFIAWYFGIVFFNGDMAFTLLNVVSHGIPYMALIWLMAHKEQAIAKKKGFSTLLFRAYGLLVFVGVIVLFAYMEEGLWDGLVWKEHASVFGLFSGLPKMSDKNILAILIPLLSLPQSTHYVLDGFIWKRTVSSNQNLQRRLV